MSEHVDQAPTEIGRVKLFGEPTFPGDPPLASQRVFAYAAIHRDAAHQRDQLVDKLTMPNRKALRQALWSLGDLKDNLSIRADWIGYRQNGYAVDLIDFEYGGDLRAYSGPLLGGWADEWVTYHRVRLEQLFLKRTTLLMRTEANGRRWEEVAQHAESILCIEPTFEVAHRALMEAYWNLDLPDLALRQYQSLVEILQGQLGARPARETRDFYKLIKKEIE